MNENRSRDDFHPEFSASLSQSSQELGPGEKSYKHHRSFSSFTIEMNLFYMWQISFLFLTHFLVETVIIGAIFF